MQSRLNLLERIAQAATREHTLRGELRILAKCALLGTVVGSLAGLLIGAAR